MERTLALAWLLLFNVVATLLVTLAGSLAVDEAIRPRLRPACGWRLRLAPAAHLARIRGVWCSCRPTGAHEPRDFVEGFDVSLTDAGRRCARRSSAGAIARGATAARGAKRRTDKWMRAARAAPACRHVDAGVRDRHRTRR